MIGELKNGSHVVITKYNGCRKNYKRLDKKYIRTK